MTPKYLIQIGAGRSRVNKNFSFSSTRSFEVDFFDLLVRYNVDSSVTG